MVSVEAGAMKPGREARASVMKRCPINALVIASQQL